MPVPEVLLAAYRQAAAGSPPACHLPVSLLAAIGQVESGSLAGRSIDATHRAAPPVLGPVLDGVGTAAIRDTDGGRLDGDSRWDRAVGPMQFIPGTWAGFGVDGDSDGRADPQNVYDATAAAAGYLCAGGRDLALPSGLRSAILSYNHSNTYLATVLAWQQRFTASGTTQAVIVAISTPAMPDTNAGSTNAGSTNAIASTATAGSTNAATRPGHPAITPTTTGTPSIPGTPTTPSTRVASRLAFTTAPSAAAASGTALDQQPVVTVQDWAGNTVNTDTSSVMLTLTTPDGATLTCATNATAAAYGVASFAGCAIDKAGTYTLTATDGSLTSATSTAVAITAGAPATVTVVSGSAQSATAGQDFASPLVARVTDADATPVRGVSLTFTAPEPGASGTFANTTATTAALSDANGLATTGVVRANLTAGTYSLRVTAGSISSTFTLTNSPGAASTFAITSAPLNGPASADASLGLITVELQDLHGNPVPAPTGGAEIVLASDSAGIAVFAADLAGTSVASILIPAGKSSVAFYYGDTAPGRPVITTSGLLISAKQTQAISAEPSPTTTAP